MYRTVDNREPQLSREHRQEAKGKIVCPFCRAELDWDAAGAARLCRKPISRELPAPNTVNGLCEKCSGAISIRLVPETTQIRVIGRVV
jgi:hypothetical protein